MWTLWQLCSGLSHLLSHTSSLPLPLFMFSLHLCLYLLFAALFISWIPRHLMIVTHFIFRHFDPNESGSVHYGEFVWAFFNRRYVKLVGHIYYGVICCQLGDGTSIINLTSLDCLRLLFIPSPSLPPDTLHSPSPCPIL